MKQFITGLISLFITLGAQAQTLETGLAVNKTYLWQSNSGVDGVDRSEGLGISAMARYQRPKSFFLFRNNEVESNPVRKMGYLQRKSNNSN